MVWRRSFGPTIPKINVLTGIHEPLILHTSRGSTSRLGPGHRDFYVKILGKHTTSRRSTSHYLRRHPTWTVSAETCMRAALHGHALLYTYKRSNHGVSLLHPSRSQINDHAPTTLSHILHTYARVRCPKPFPTPSLCRTAVRPPRRSTQLPILSVLR